MGDSEQVIPVDDWKDVREQLDPGDAQRIGGGDMPLALTKEIQRNWPDVSTDMAERCTRFLYMYADAANAKAGFVVNGPQCGRDTYPGIWRNAGVGISKERSGIKGVFQTLRYGFASRLAWDECQVIGGQQEKATEQSLSIQWHSIDPAHLQDCLTSLTTAGTATDPVIQLETYTGVWQYGPAVVSKNDDGSHIIRLTITKVTVIVQATAYAQLALLTPREERWHTIDHPYGQGGGYSSSTGRQYSDGIVRYWPGLSLSSRAAITPRTAAEATGLTDVELHNLVGASDLSTFELIKGEVSESKEDNTLTLKVTYGRVGKIAWTNADADLTNYDSAGTRFEKRTRYWFGIQSADEATALAALAQGGASGNVTNYQVTSVTANDNEDESLTFVQVIEYAETWPAIVPPATVATVPTPHLTEYPKLVVGNATTPAVLTVEWTWYSYKATDIQTAIDALKASTAYGAIAGYFGSVVARDRRNGIFDIVAQREYQLSSAVLHGWTIGDTFTKVNNDYHRIQAKDGTVWDIITPYTSTFQSHASWRAAMEHLQTLTGINTPFGQDRVIDAAGDGAWYSVHMAKAQATAVQIFDANMGQVSEPVPE